MPWSGCGVDADCRQGELCQDDGTCGEPSFTPSPRADAGPTSCGGELFRSTRVQANLLILLDKSGSMKEESGGRSKWSIAVDAVKSITSQNDDAVRFGLGLFPEDDNCAVGALSVQVGDQTSAAIGQVLDQSEPKGNTPIAGVLRGALMVPELFDPVRAPYVLLITDGKETCKGNPVESVRELRTKNIKTYAVGFGKEVDPQTLSEMAVEGGTARQGNVPYFQADDADALKAALSSIAAGAQGCDFQLSKPPPDADRIFVYVAGALAVRDPSRTNGWEYHPGANRISLYGATCEAAANNPAMKVSVVYGCPDESLIEDGPGRGGPHGSGTPDGGLNSGSPGGNPGGGNPGGGTPGGGNPTGPLPDGGVRPGEEGGLN